MLTTGAGDDFHLRNGWFDAWIAAFGGTRIEGLPVVAAHERLGPLRYRVLRGATNPHSVNYDAAPDVDLPDDLPERLLRASAAVAVRFDYLHEDARLLHAARRWGARHRVAIAPHALAPVVDCRGTHAAWLARRSKRIRTRMRRDQAQALDALGMRFELSSDDPVENGVLAHMLALERAGWKGRGGTAILDDPAATRFYTDLARRAAAAGALRLALLWHGDRLVAFEYGVLGGRRLFLLKVAYDEDHADLSLGYVIAALHIRDCFEHPSIDWYDKMGNGMTPAPYKLRYADACDVLHRVTLYAPGALGSAVHARDRLRARVAGWRRAWRARKSR